jgi:hypothetical protein
LNLKSESTDDDDSFISAIAKLIILLDYFTSSLILSGLICCGEDFSSLFFVSLMAGFR